LRIVARKIKTVLNQDAPVAIAKAIAKGISAELDDLRAISTSGRILRRNENENHKRQNFFLKISFNNVFGYYIEVRNMHKDKVPTEWIENKLWLMRNGILQRIKKKYENY
jgi:DNA mismatch repair protein MutS